MKRTSVFLFFCLLLSLNACAFAPVNKPVVDRKKSVVLAEFDLSLENAKALVEKTYDIMGYQKAREEQKSGGFMLSTNDKAMPSVGNCDCGTWNGSKIQGTISSAIITALEPISAEKNHCASNGDLCHHVYRTQFIRRHHPAGGREMPVHG